MLIEDETLRADSLRLVQQVREAGTAVEFTLVATKGDKQFKRALELGARQTLRVERSAEGTVAVRIKNLRTREEQMVPFDQVVAALAGAA